MEYRLQQADGLDDLENNEKKQKGSKFDLEGVVRRKLCAVDEFGSTLPVDGVTAYTQERNRKESEQQHQP